MSLNKLLQTKKLTANILIFSVVAVFASLVTVLVQAPQAKADWGSGGSGVGGSGSGYWTSNGFGWKRFSKFGGGPSGGFRDGTSWGTIQSACSQYSSDGVWVHVVRNSGGGEQSYNYSGSSWNRNRPTAGLDPYYYDINGNPANQGPSHTAHVISIVSTMQSRFALEHSAYLGHWGVDVAWFCDGPRVPPRTVWSINGQSYVRAGGGANAQGPNAVTALPGQVVTWDHDLRNVGPQNMDLDLHLNVHTQNYSLADGSAVGAGGVARSASGLRGNAGQLFYTAYGLTRTITQADVGTRFCQHIAWAPAAWNNGAAVGSTQACASVPYRYTLQPRIDTITDGTVVESTNTPVDVDGTVVNNGPTRAPTGIYWQITQVEYTVPLTAIPNKGGGVGSSSDPCGYFVSNTSCNNLASGTTSAITPFPGSIPAEAFGSLLDKPAGTKVCFALSVNPYTSNPSPAANSWAHSPLQCLVVGKKPKVQVLSGDLLLGRRSPTNDARQSDVITSISGNNGRYYGSWAEYAIVPSGCVTGMASSSAFVGGSTTDILQDLSNLTFTRPSGVTCSTNIGGYSHNVAAPDIASRFPINVAAGGVEPANPRVLPANSVLLSDLTDTYQAPALVTSIEVRGGSEIPVGRKVVINAPNADVRITGNIIYSGSDITKLQDIPQVIIIARNIIISDAVERIDAWLVATGTGTEGRINTCGEGAGGVTQDSNLTLATCNRQLVVNGPVLANHLLLRRTAGADTSSREIPAEIFNLRPDAYLWATGYNLSTGRLSTVETKELPPRY